MCPLHFNENRSENRMYTYSASFIRSLLLLLFVIIISVRVGFRLAFRLTAAISNTLFSEPRPRAAPNGRTGWTINSGARRKNASSWILRMFVLRVSVAHYNGDKQKSFEITGKMLSVSPSGMGKTAFRNPCNCECVFVLLGGVWVNEFAPELIAFLWLFFACK